MKKNLAGLSWMVLLGCSPTGGAADGGADAGPTFQAVTKDFQNYTSWEPFHMGAGPLDGGTHTSGPRTAFLKSRPPHGSSAFPVGTIIVKQTNEDSPSSRRIFAMVKRGGGYNSSGAKDWEWFELASNDGGSVFINWRGLGPPAGESYGPADQTCNACHAGAKDNDYVQAEPLQLHNF